MTIVFHGGKNMALQLALRLRARGLDARVIYYPSIVEWISLDSSGQITDDTPWVYPARRSRRRFLAYADLWRARRMAERMADHIIASDLTSAVFFRTKIPLAVWCHGEELRRIALSRRHSAFAMRSILRHARLIISNQPDHWSALERLGMTHKAVYIPTPIEEGLWTPSAAPPPRKGGFEVVVPSWHSNSVKGTDKMIDGFRLFAARREDAHMTMFAFGPDLERSEALIRRNGLGSRVSILPVANSRDLKPIIEGACCVIDSLNYGILGRVSYEAMSLNVPVICNMDENLYRSHYDELPPVLNASTSADVCDRLADVYGSRWESLTRPWIRKHHTADRAVGILLKSGFLESKR